MHGRQYGNDPYDGNAPEKEKETILQPSCHLDAADGENQKSSNRQTGDVLVVNGQRDPQRLEQCADVKTESQCFTAGHRNHGNEETPAGQHTKNTAEPEGSVLIGAAGEGKGSAHLGVKQRGIDTDDQSSQCSKNDRRSQQPDNIGANRKQADADHRPRGNRDRFTQT